MPCWVLNTVLLDKNICTTPVIRIKPTVMATISSTSEKPRCLSSLTAGFITDIFIRLNPGGVRESGFFQCIATFIGRGLGPANANRTFTRSTLNASCPLRQNTYQRVYFAIIKGGHGATAWRTDTNSIDDIVGNNIGLRAQIGTAVILQRACLQSSQRHQRSGQHQDGNQHFDQAYAGLVALIHALPHGHSLRCIVTIPARPTEITRWRSPLQSATCEVNSKASVPLTIMPRPS